MTGRSPRPLGADYYRSSALSLAPDMLGKVICRKLADGVVRRYRITETEAYFGEDDTACHAHRCSTGRARVMYSAGGLAYVHRCHMYNLLTIVTGPEGTSPCTGRRCPRRDTSGWRTMAVIQSSRGIPASAYRMRPRRTAPSCGVSECPNNDALSDAIDSGLRCQKLQSESTWSAMSTRSART